MSETEIITESKKVDTNFKISKSEFFDLMMAILNALIIISIFSLLRNRTLFSNIFGFTFIGILIGGAFITFLKRNPFYIYFCYGFTFCGILGDVYLISTNIIFTILFIPQALYVYSKIGDLFLEPNRYIFSGKSKEQISEENRRREIEEIKKREIEKKLKFNSIALISLCCSLGLFITLIFSA